MVNLHKEHADQFADRYQVKKTYYDYVAMFAGPNVDIVYIAAPHTYIHYEQIKQALNAKKHVFCEKAITVRRNLMKLSGWHTQKI